MARYRVEPQHNTGSVGFNGADVTADTTGHRDTCVQALSTLLQTPLVAIDVTTGARTSYTPAGAGSALSNATGFAVYP